MKLRLEPGRIAWWYWTASVALLAVGVAGYTPAFPAVVALTVVHAVHWIARARSLSAFAVQVRLGYFVLLAIGLWEPMRWIYVLPLIGSIALILFGWCPMARTLALMPWNRPVPFTLGLLRRAFLSPPFPGTVLEALYLSEDDPPAP